MHSFWFAPRLCSAGLLVGVFAAAAVASDAGAQTRESGSALGAASPRQWLEVSMGSVGTGVPMPVNNAGTLGMALRRQTRLDRVDARFGAVWTPALEQLELQASGLFRVAALTRGRLGMHPYLFGGLGGGTSGENVGLRAGAGARVSLSNLAVQLEWGRHPGRGRNVLTLGVGVGWQ